MTVSAIPDRYTNINPASRAQFLASPGSQGTVKSRIPSIYLSFSRFPHRILVKSRIPKIPFQTLLKGQSGEVTCKAQGPSVSTLKWEKQQDDKSYAAVPNSQVNITKDANYVRATLKITNAHFSDTGTYKCTVSVPSNKSDYKRTNITVKGMFACLFVYILPAQYDF